VYEGESAANVSGTASAVLDDREVPSLSHLPVSSMPNEPDKSVPLDVPAPSSTGKSEGLVDEEAVTMDFASEAGTVVHGQSSPLSSCVVESQRQCTMQQVSSPRVDGSYAVDAGLHETLQFAAERMCGPLDKGFQAWYSGEDVADLPSLLQLVARDRAHHFSRVFLDQLSSVSGSEKLEEDSLSLLKEAEQWAKQMEWTDREPCVKCLSGRNPTMHPELLKAMKENASLLMTALN